MLKLARLKLPQLLRVLGQRHFELLSLHLTSQWHVERHSISFFKLGDVNFGHLVDAEAGIVAHFQSVFVLVRELFIRLDLVDSVHLVVKVERIRLFVRDVHVAVVHRVGLAQTQGVLLCSDRSVELAFPLALVGKWSRVAQPAEVLGDEGDVETLALKAACRILFGPLRGDADGRVRHQRCSIMVAIEANLDLRVRFRRNEIMASERATLYAGTRSVAIGIGYYTAALNYIQPLRGVLDLTLELQDLLIQLGTA